MQTNYFNTTNLTDPTLSEYKRINESQDTKILKCFRKHRYRKMTPFMVKELADISIETPITSIRRSINTLTAAGYLVKLDEKKQGGYGRANSLWTLKIGTV